MGKEKKKDDKERRQPIIVFLTDGEPNVGVDSGDTIVELVSRFILPFVINLQNISETYYCG